MIMTIVIHTTVLISTGPVSPYKPVDLVIVFSTHTSVTVQWTVPFIAYTDESYFIKYGPSLASTTSSVPGSDDRSTLNGMFDITITGLVADTTYKFVVVAVNSFGETNSDISTFVTEELRKYS